MATELPSHVPNYHQKPFFRGNTPAMSANLDQMTGNLKQRFGNLNQMFGNFKPNNWETKTQWSHDGRTMVARSTGA